MRVGQPSRPAGLRLLTDQLQRHALPRRRARGFFPLRSSPQTCSLSVHGSNSPRNPHPADREHDPPPGGDVPAARPLPGPAAAQPRRPRHHRPQPPPRSPRDHRRHTCDSSPAGRTPGAAGKHPSAAGQSPGPRRIRPNTLPPHDRQQQPPSHPAAPPATPPTPARKNAKKRVHPAPKHAQFITISKRTGPQPAHRRHPAARNSHAGQAPQPYPQSCRCVRSPR